MKPKTTQSSYSLDKPLIYKGITYMVREGSEQHKRLSKAVDLYRARDIERAHDEFHAALSADPC